jgi:hypothetical protein
MLGPSMSMDFNLGLILDTLNPNLRVDYRAAGVLHRRAYTARIRTIGLKADISCRMQGSWLRIPSFALVELLFILLL